MPLFCSSSLERLRAPACSKASCVGCHKVARRTENLPQLRGKKAMICLGLMLQDGPRADRYKWSDTGSL